jgi:DNA (cytosine-5)-methyltransferase 1
MGLPVDGAGLTVLEICAGAGGQSRGLERAGFRHVGAVEIDARACATLRRNRPGWHVVEGDVRDVDGTDYLGVSLLAGGVPCPPFSIAGKQRGSDDERDLFPEALRLVRESKPRAVMLENVRGFAGSRFEPYRTSLKRDLLALGYESDWRVLNASDYGVSQLRPRFILVAMAPDEFANFSWPEGAAASRTVGEELGDLMASQGWLGALAWKQRAADIAPTIVGGSHKHGGADLGPTRAKLAWRALGVDGYGVADAAPDAHTPTDHAPRLTLRMVARLQGFEDDWEFEGRKTAAYRQIGNAFPPPVAEAVGRRIRSALDAVAAAGETERLVATG